MTKFAANQNKGFHMRFTNGWTISVQFGWANYCENRFHPDGYNFSTQQFFTESSDAEIAIWDNNEQDYIFDFGDGFNDTVKGHCSPDEVAKWINFTCMQEPVEVEK
jgi:hypothetical protein